MPVGRPTLMMRAAIFFVDLDLLRGHAVVVVHPHQKPSDSTQETSWLTSVAMAAPATPIFSPAMSTRSRRLFVPDAMPRYSSDRWGVARRVQDARRHVVHDAEQHTAEMICI